MARGLRRNSDGSLNYRNDELANSFDYDINQHDRRGKMSKFTTLDYIKYSVLGVILLFIISICLGSFYTVESGERGVLLRFGDVVSVEDPGLHFKVPFIETVKFMDTRSQNIALKTSVYSADTQAAEVNLSINFQLNPADVKKIYITYGKDYVNRIVLPQIQTQCKDAFGTFTAIDIVRNREKLASKIYDNLLKYLTGQGIMVTSVQIENLDFSDEYEKSVEERMKAEVEVAKLHQSLEQQKIRADMARTEAQGNADAKLTQARASAEATRLQGEAEAAVINAKAKAMSQAGSNYVELIQAEKWNGILPSTMLPNQSLPILK